MNDDDDDDDDDDDSNNRFSADVQCCVSNGVAVLSLILVFYVSMRLLLRDERLGAIAIRGR